MRQNQRSAGSCLPGLTDKSAPFQLSAGIFVSACDKNTAYKLQGKDNLKDYLLAHRVPKSRTEYRRYCEELHVYAPPPGCDLPT